MYNAKELKTLIRQMSLDLGFDALGFTDADELSDDSAALKDWITRGFNADMQYMQNNFEKRIHPEKLVPDAKTVVVFLKNYYPSDIDVPSTYKVSKYAFGRDYHKTLKKKLQTMLSHLQNNYGIEGRAFVDSAPVLERALARRAGLGFIGKNACLISKEIGSFCFICELIIDADLAEENDEVIDACGNCRKCLDACPTGALLGPRLLDSSKCISYLSIEKSEPFNLDEEQHLRTDRYIFGCDICQDVCPWNSKALPTTESDFAPRKGITVWQNEQWEQMDEPTFFETFAGTPLMRAGHAQMQRNVSAIKNKP